MLKSFAAILLAATIAAAITLLSAPTTDVIASPLPEPTVEAIRDCTQQPWPYSNCAGSELGKVRLIPIDRAG
jgi:hypothetical protein